MKTAHQQNTSARFTFTAKAPREGNLGGEGETLLVGLDDTEYAFGRLVTCLWKAL